MIIQPKIIPTVFRASIRYLRKSLTDVEATNSSGFNLITYHHKNKNAQKNNQNRFSHEKFFLYQTILEYHFRTIIANLPSANGAKQALDRLFPV